MATVGVKGLKLLSLCEVVTNLRDCYSIAQWIGETIAPCIHTLETIAPCIHTLEPAQ